METQIDEEILTDGSKVFNVQLNAGNCSVTFCMRDEKAAWEFLEHLGDRIDDCSLIDVDVDCAAMHR